MTETIEKKIDDELKRMEREGIIIRRGENVIITEKGRALAKAAGLKQ